MTYIPLSTMSWEQHMSVLSQDSIHRLPVSVGAINIKKSTEPLQLSPSSSSHTFVSVILEESNEGSVREQVIGGTERTTYRISPIAG